MSFELASAFAPRPQEAAAASTKKTRYSLETSGSGRSRAAFGSVGVRVASVHDLTIDHDDSLPPLAALGDQDHRRPPAARDEERPAAHGARPRHFVELPHVVPGVSGMVLHVRSSEYAVTTRARAKAETQARARAGPDARPARADGT